VFAAAAVAGVAALLAASARSASAISVERIHRYDVDFVIEADGHVDVTETIDYDFGDEPHHGIYRDLELRTRPSPTRAGRRTSASAARPARSRASTPTCSRTACRTR
jgi:hypothetical protein